MIIIKFIIITSSSFICIPPPIITKLNQMSKPNKAFVLQNTWLTLKGDGKDIYYIYIYIKTEENTNITFL